MKFKKLFQISIFVLIVLNVLAVILETVESLFVQYETFFRIFEVFSVIVFSVEYVYRLWTCIEEKRFKNPFLGRIRYSFTFLAIIDLLAILPFYFPMIFPVDLRFIRALRLFRLIRLLKIGRYSKSLITLQHVIKSKKEELLITVFAGGVLLILTSSLMYYIEHTVQPEAFSSIPASLWWGVITLTTVGYGDVYPVTSIGRILAAFMAFIGIGLFALPAGIVASGFTEVIKKNKNKCPHCGEDIA